MSKLLSLFDGSGGFPLAAIMSGIEPVAASEIEPFPIRVTTKRFPNMKHLGDVSQINGAEIEPVDVITFGSPCQDLSIAGKRKGLNGQRSGLYVHAVRIIKEMFESTNGEYPKFLIFENVPGLLSSNKGEDFITALDMLQNIGFIPDPNILDAQDMGVPQRRKRVYITWANVNYILSKKTNLSDSITLQLLTEILQINLVDLLIVLGIERRKSAVLGLKYYEDGLNRRINLFSLQKESHLHRLQKRLDEMQVMFLKDQKNSDFIHGEDQMDLFMWITEDTKSLNLKMENQYMSIGQLLKKSLEDGLQIKNEYITSTWTKEIIIQKICFYVKALQNTLKLTLLLMRSLGKEQIQSLNYYEWVLYILIEMEEFINAARKNEKKFRCVGRNDFLRNIECDISTYREFVERCFRGQRAGKILFESEGVRGDSETSREQRQGTAGNAERGTGTVYAIENHPADSRIKIDESGKCQTLTSRMGTDGGNVPLVYCLQGNGIDRADTAGCNGRGWNDETCYTLNTIDRPAAAYAMQAIGEYKESDKGSSMKARDYKDATDLIVEKSQVLAMNEPTYIVRRLTPLECCRLQGFPDWWCDGLETEEPNEEELKFWREVFETHRKIVTGSSKPKSDKQIIKWLKDPYSDSAIYKMWGNGIALPNALFVMLGIAEELQRNKEEER